MFLQLQGIYCSIENGGTNGNMAVVVARTVPVHPTLFQSQIEDIRSKGADSHPRNSGYHKCMDHRIGVVAVWLTVFEVQKIIHQPTHLSEAKQ